MPDSFPAEIRSKIMSKIKGKDTSPELAVRSYLHRKGFRYRLHGNELPGKPDLIFAKYRVAVFIHGCFWHQHPKKGCPHSGIPKSNGDYWGPKLKRTIERDKENRRKLEEANWRVEVIWECEISESMLEILCSSIKGKHTIKGKGE